MGFCFKVPAEYLIRSFFFYSKRLAWMCWKLHNHHLHCSRAVLSDAVHRPFSWREKKKTMKRKTDDFKTSDDYSTARSWARQRICRANNSYVVLHWSISVNIWTRTENEKCGTCFCSTIQFLLEFSGNHQPSFAHILNGRSICDNIDTSGFFYSLVCFDKTLKPQLDEYHINEIEALLGIMLHFCV